MKGAGEQLGWLGEPWVRALLLDLLQRLERPRSRDVTLRINERTLPALFDFSADVDGRWQLIEQELVQRWRVFSVTFDRRLLPHQQPYENAQLRLRADSEELLRQWLGRPRIDPIEAEWLAAIDRHADPGRSAVNRDALVVERQRNRCGAGRYNIIAPWLASTSRTSGMISSVQT